MKHIIVFLAFEDVNIIKTSFDSLKCADSDFFIIENNSKNSDEIKKYFFKQKLKGYIQFEKNARANAVNIFIRDYYNLLLEYDFITITDGDLFVYDIKQTLDEIISTFSHPQCYVCGASLYMGNLYSSPNKVIGLQPYIEHMIGKANVAPASTIGRTGCYLLTFNKKTLFLIKDIHFIDTNIFNNTVKHGGKCFKTTKNVAYHLTWDLYFDGNPYYENKKNNLANIWAHSNEDFKYNKLK